MSRIPAPFSEVCERAHPTNGNAKALYAMVGSIADIYRLAQIGEAFGPEARRELGDGMIAWLIANGHQGESAIIARDPAYRDVVSMASLVASGAVEEVAARRRLMYSGCVAVDGAGGFETDEDAERQVQWGEMPAIGGGR